VPGALRAPGGPTGGAGRSRPTVSPPTGAGPRSPCGSRRVPA
jgi:hypothetical protein